MFDLSRLTLLPKLLIASGLVVIIAMGVFAFHVVKVNNNELANEARPTSKEQEANSLSSAQKAATASQPSGTTSAPASTPAPATGSTVPKTSTATSKSTAKTAAPAAPASTPAPSNPTDPGKTFLQNFYNSYVAALKTYLTGGPKSALDQVVYDNATYSMINTYDTATGGDPILCSQNVPTSVMVLGRYAGTDQAPYHQVFTNFSNGGGDFEVLLSRYPDNSYRLGNVFC